MKKSLTLTVAIVVVTLCLASFAHAAIYISGQLYGSNTLDITESAYSTEYVTLTEDSVVNIHYADLYSPSGNFYLPGVNPSIIAQENSIVNFIYPPNYNFSIFCGDDKQMDVYSRLKIDGVDYPSIAPAFWLLRNYDPGVPHVLTPEAGGYQLQGSAVMNFIPEPSTVLLLLTGISGLMKTRRP